MRRKSLKVQNVLSNWKRWSPSQRLRQHSIEALTSRPALPTRDNVCLSPRNCSPQVRYQITTECGKLGSWNACILPKSHNPGTQPLSTSKQSSINKPISVPRNPQTWNLVWTFPRAFKRNPFQSRTRLLRESRRSCDSSSLSRSLKILNELNLNDSKNRRLKVMECFWLPVLLLDG
jgi:hypothetical protein